ncbi:MAG: glycosyltransferase family 39 protein, partial [Chloroflexota bacterium]
MRHRYIVLLLLLATFALWTHPLDHESLWRDEVDTIRFAFRSWESIQKHHSGIELVKDWTSQLTSIGENGPLYFWIMGIWLRIVGQTEVALRLSSTFSAIVAIALMFTIGKTIFNSRVGLVGSTLLAVNPYVSWYAGEGKMYTLILCLVLLSTLLLSRAL